MIKVPALYQGLMIIEECLRKKIIRFSEVQELLSLSKASTARLLNQLLDLHYLVKQREGYMPGPKLQDMFPYTQIVDRLAQASQTVLESLTRETCNTSMVTYWNGTSIQVVAKTCHPESVVMQDIGDVRTDILYYPWGWIFFLEQSDHLQQKQLSDINESETWLNHLHKGLDSLKEHHFAYEGLDGRARFHRLAAPIHYHQQVIGALSMGITGGDSLPEETILELATLLIQNSKHITTNMES